MYEIRYYFGKGPLDYDVVDRYYTPSLAYGMRKKLAEEPQYNLDTLKVRRV